MIERAQNMGCFCCGCLAEGEVWVGTSDGGIHGLDRNSLEEVHSSNRHSAAVTSLLYQARSGHVFSASQDFTILRWSLSSKAVDLCLAGHHGGVKGITLLDDGWGALASYSDDGTVRCWDSDTGATLAQWDVADVSAIAGAGRQVWIGTTSGRLLVVEEKGTETTGEALLVAEHTRTATTNSHDATADVMNASSHSNNTAVAASRSIDVSRRGVSALLATSDTVWVSYKDGSIAVYRGHVSASDGATLLKRLNVAEGTAHQIVKVQAATLDIVWLIGENRLEECSIHSTLDDADVQLAQSKLRGLYDDEVSRRKHEAQLQSERDDAVGQLQVARSEIERLKRVIADKDSGADKQIVKDLEISKAKAVETSQQHLRRLRAAVEERDKIASELKASNEENKALRQAIDLYHERLAEASIKEKKLEREVDVLSQELYSLLNNGTTLSGASSPTASASQLPPPSPASSSANGKDNRAAATSGGKAFQDAELQHRAQHWEKEAKKLSADVQNLQDALESATTELVQRRIAETQGKTERRASWIRGSEIGKFLVELDAQVHSLHELTGKLSREAGRSSARSSQKSLETCYTATGVLQSKIVDFASSHEAISTHFRPTAGMRDGQMQQGSSSRRPSGSLSSLPLSTHASPVLHQSLPQSADRLAEQRGAESPRNSADTLSDPRNPPPPPTTPRAGPGRSSIEKSTVTATQPQVVESKAGQLELLQQEDLQQPHESTRSTERSEKLQEYFEEF